MFSQIVRANARGEDSRVDVVFPHAAGNELAVLGAKIEDGDGWLHAAILVGGLRNVEW